MATLLIFFLFITATVLYIFKKKRTAFSILILSILSYEVIGSGLLPSILLKQLQQPFLTLTQIKWQHKNALILLGAGAIKLPGKKEFAPTIMAYSRINTTAGLYFACIKSRNDCKIIISGGDALKIGQSEAVVYQHALLALGVPISDTILESNSLNTFKNAEFTNVILNKNHFDQIILITSGIHLRRALLYFSHFGMNAKPVMSDYLVTQVRTLPVGYNFATTDFAMHEYLGIMRFHLYNFLNWNKAVSSAGDV